MFYDPDIILTPVIAVALALIVFGVPYCFISDIKDLRVRWGFMGAYAGFLLSLIQVADLHHFEELWTVFSLAKTLVMISLVSIGALSGWKFGAWVNSGKLHK